MGKANRTDACRALRKKVDAENEAKANAPFERSASLYDATHGDVNHAAWAQRVADHLGQAPHGIVDWCCRTGQLTGRLAKLGYAVTGVESHAGLARIAKSRHADVLIGSPLTTPFHTGRKFDGACCMDFGLGYLSPTNEALIRTLRSIRGHLHRGSRFVFDAIHAPFAAAEGIVIKPAVTVHGGVVSHRHDYHAERSQVELVLDFKTESGEFRERHFIRAFSAPEIRLALFLGGFKTLGVFTPHLESQDAPTTDDPLLLAVAEAA